MLPMTQLKISSQGIRTLQAHNYFQIVVLCSQWIAQEVGRSEDQHSLTEQIIDLSIYISIYLFIYLSIYLSIHLLISISLSIQLDSFKYTSIIILSNIYTFIYLLYLCIYPTIYLSMFLSSLSYLFSHESNGFIRLQIASNI